MQTYGSRGLPPVRVVFLEDEKSGTSWFDKDGKLKISIPLPAELLLGEEREQSSDLLLLLRALAPVRGSNKFFVEPTLPNSFQNLDFSLAWMAQNSTQKQRFGECIDMRWNDALSFHWLTRFEIYLHRLLHNLDTPIAPFLRLEQMATVSHHKHQRISRYAARYRQTSEICRGADDIMTAVGSCAFALAPAQGLSLCQCVNSAKGLTDTNDKAHACCVLGFGEYCTRSCGAQNYQDLYDTQSKNWEDEFVALRRRLLSLNGCILTDDGRFVTKNFQPLNSPITLGQIFGFKHNINDRPTTAWEFNNIGNRCGCFIPKALPKQGTRNLQKTRRSDPEAWIKAWPYGIIHDKGIIRSYRARHECQQLQEDPYANGRYLCLDRSRRDENGICDGGKQNTSASFLEQFAHLTTKSSQHNSSGPLVTQSFGV